MNKDNSPALVVLAGSAGSHSAMTQIFRAMDENFSACIAVIQHLSPARQSILVDLIQKHTSREVMWLEDGHPVLSNRVYVVPPDREAMLEDQTFRLRPSPRVIGGPGLIDTLGFSLANSGLRERVMVLLSGAGHDGANAIRSLKASGGLTVVQSPDSASHPDLPRAALSAAEPDLVLHPARIPAAIENALVMADSTRYSAEEWNAGLQRALQILENETGLDFRGYKKATMRRRLERRLGIRGTNLEQYLPLLEGDQEEQKALTQDLLINVTSFFRDEDVFRNLSDNIMPDLLRDSGHSVRFWVAACSTGEEAYSLAMILRESMDRLGIHRDVQIFATDVDTRSLEMARRGFYSPVAMAGLSGERIRNHFVLEKDGYRIRNSLREMVLFSEHNLLKDPPFSRMDFISCRNMLIYLEKEMQQKALRAFHYALADNGVLLLGHSESVGEHQTDFEAINSGHRLFRRKNGVGSSLLHYSIPSYKKKAPEPEGRTIPELAREAVLRRFTPPSVLINTRNDILFVQGKTGAYLELPTGTATNDILSMARAGLRVPLSNALRKARASGQEIQVKGVFLGEPPDLAETVEIVVSPMESVEHRNLLLVTFLPGEKRELPGNKEDAETENTTVQQLRQELEQTRDHLESTIHELEQANEELRTTNESAETANEELQSANEELETSREELQSLNEELLTTNTELQHKIEAVTQANNDIHNLLRSTQLPVMFLDRELGIRWFSPEMARMMKLEDSDVGRSILSFRHGFLELDWNHHLQGILSDLIPRERTLESEDGRYFSLRVLPYRTLDDRVDGAVFTFQDITESRQQQRELEKHRNNLERLVEERSGQLERSRQLLEQTGKVALVGGWEMDVSTKRIEWTSVTRSIFEVSDDFDPNYQDGMGFFTGSDQQKLTNHISLALSHGRPYDIEMPITTAEGNSKWILLSGRPMMEGGQCIRIYGSVQDITERKQWEARLEQTTNMLLRTEHVANLGSWEWDIETDTVTWSEELYNIFRVPEEEGPPSYARQHELYPPESLKKLESAVRDAIEKKMPYFLELEAVRRDGKQIFGIATGLPIKDARGKVVSLYGSFQDITQRALAQREAIRAREEAEKANRAKTVFLGNLSHELRTPMNAIIGMTELALEESLPQEARGFLQTVRHASDHLMNIIGDLLDSAVMENGRLELIQEPFSLRAAIEKTAAIVEGMMEEKGLFFNVNIEQDLPDNLVGDSKRCCQVLINLLSNAAKYTQEGGVELTIQRGSLPQAKNLLLLNISVSDTGAGIAEKDLESIFEKFTQVGGTRNRLLKQSTGTGIGLYIARNIVETMGGHIDVQSEVGKGSTFILSVPFEVAEPDYRNTPEETIPELKAMAILMAEDNAVNALVQRTVLEQENHTVTTVSNGHEALQVLARGNYDLVLMDLEMPVLDGFEATVAIRNGKAGSNNGDIPIIAVTAHVLSDVEDQCLRCGMDGFVTKPIDVMELTNTLAKILLNKSRRTELSP